MRLFHRFMIERGGFFGSGVAQCRRKLVSVHGCSRFDLLVLFRPRVNIRSKS